MSRRKSDIFNDTGTVPPDAEPEEDAFSNTLADLEEQIAEAYAKSGSPEKARLWHRYAGRDRHCED